MTDVQKDAAMRITMKLAQLGHEVTWQAPITEGPLITTYRFVPRATSKVQAICGCAQDLALALACEDVLVRRLPGEGVIGVSVPNATRTLVQWRDTLQKPDHKFTVPLNLGVDSQGRLFKDDLAMCPHLLIAGSTFGGKSMLLNSLIASLMYWRTPTQVQFVLSDTKSGGGLEFNHYRESPFLARPPANSMYTTWELMDWLSEQADSRLREIARAGCQNIGQYNAHGADDYTQLLPYIVFVIDELADVLCGEGRGEKTIAQDKLGRIVQKSRAAGIYVIAATQRSSVDVIAGTVKNNFPARLTFKLASQADSRTIIDEAGAEHLLARGDMLYRGPGAPALTRLHSPYTDLFDIKQMTELAAMRTAQAHGGE